MGLVFLGAEIWDPPLSLGLLLLLRIKNGKNSIFQNLIFFSTIKLFDISYVPDGQFLLVSYQLFLKRRAFWAAVPVGAEVL